MDNLISKCPEQTKDNNKRKNTVRFNERSNRASQNESEDGDDDNDKKIYASMERMSIDDKISSRYFPIDQLDFRFRSNVSYETSGFGFISGPLEDTDKYIEVSDGNYAMVKQKGQVQITT